MAGGVELATAEETIAGTDTERAVTPDAASGPVGDKVSGKGTFGPQGPVGPKGPDGDRGLTGSQGAQGPSRTGAKGPVGDNGPVGDTGPKGATGNMGPPGQTHYRRQLGYLGNTESGLDSYSLSLPSGGRDGDTFFVGGSFTQAIFCSEDHIEYETRMFSVAHSRSGGSWGSGFSTGDFPVIPWIEETEE